MLRSISILYIIFILSLPLFAQFSQIKIVGKSEKIEIPVQDIRDINGRFCAVIQVVSNLEGLRYDSYQGVVKIIDLKDKDMIYLSPDERVLEIYKSSYTPLKIILYDIGIHLKSKCVWKITVAGDIKGNEIPIIINSVPDSVTIMIDDKNFGVGKLFMMKSGKHIIQLSKPGFYEKTDTIQVDRKKSQIEFILVPKIELVFVKGGNYQIGSIIGRCKDDERPVHNTTLNDFYISKYEITFEAYDAFCEKTSHSKPHDRGWGRGKRPVIYVSWYDAVEFCNWLSEQEGLTPCYKIYKNHQDPNKNSRYDDKKWLVECNFGANGYRLPTEAEWEYASRGGLQSSHYVYSGSNNIEEVAWYPDNTGGKTNPVGTKKPNELGIYDMTGNALEWCWDWYDENYYQNSPQNNPKGTSSGWWRVLRGGSLIYDMWLCRSTYRHWRRPDESDLDFGFRVARSAY